MWRYLLALILIVGLLICGCGTKTTEIRHILRSPDDYYEKTVTIEGSVDSSYEWDWISQTDVNTAEYMTIPVRYNTENIPKAGMGNTVKATGKVRKHIDNVRIEEYPYIDVESWSYTN